MLISNLSYTHTGVPVGTTEFILIRSLYGGTHRYYRDSSDTGVPVGTQNLYLYRDTWYLVLVLQSLSLYYGSSTCTTEFILVFRILSLYYGAYTCISDFIHVFHNLYLFD